MTKTIENTRFGSIEFDDQETLHFTEGLVGFPTLTEFVLVVHRENSPFQWLQSVSEPGMAFLVTDPNRYIEDYGIEIADEEAENLALTVDGSTMIMVTASIPKGDPTKLNLNLSGPIVVNLENRLGKQLMVESEITGAFALVETEKAA